MAPAPGPQACYAPSVERLAGATRLVQRLAALTRHRTDRRNAHDGLAFCGGCGLPLPSFKGGPLDQRRPCPTCGSLVRHQPRTAFDALLQLRSSLKTSLRRAGSSRVVQEQFVGDEQSADDTWVSKTVLRDRESDRYVETVIRPDGTGLHREEPLSAHRGHGSDRPELREARDTKKQAEQAARTAQKVARDAAWRNRLPSPDSDAE